MSPVTNIAQICSAPLREMATIFENKKQSLNNILAKFKTIYTQKSPCCFTKITQTVPLHLKRQQECPMLVPF